MAASSSERDLNPTVEDYESDQSEYPVLETFRRSPAANVAAKRSHPSDLGTDKPLAEKEKVVPIDLRSDSGAKMSQTSTAPSSAASMGPPSPAPPKRRPTVVEDRRRGSESPRKPLQRNNSSASKRPAVTRRPTITQTEECRDPNCTKCGPNAAPPRRGGRRDSTALDSGLDISYPPFDVRSQRSDPSQAYTSPPSPTYNRQPAPYMQGTTMVQPAQSRPRASSTARRPMSYHGNPAPDYYMQGMSAPYPSPPQEYGPPPSMSAHYTMPHHQHHPQMTPFSMMGATPPSQFYQGGHPMAQHMSQTSPPYEQRPPLAARNSGSFQTRRPVSGQYGPPVVHADKPEQPLPSARYGNAPPSARQDRFPPAKQIMHTPHQDSESSDEYESSSSEEEAPVAPMAPPPKQLMPPPKLKSKSKKEQRPVLRHAKTTQVYNDRQDRHDRHDRRERRPSVSQSQTLPERHREKDSRAPRVSTAPPSRSLSTRRPAARPARVTQSAYDTPRAKFIVENPKTSRRQSYQAYERAYEPEYEDDDYDSEEEERLAYEEQLKEDHRREQEERRRRRRSTVYQNDDDQIIVTERPSRRRPDVSIKHDDYMKGTATAKAMDDVEAYQRGVRGTDEPISEQVHKVAKQRASRVASDPDQKTRISQSARTTVTNGNNGEIRLRVDASAPLSLSFNGDMEGRTLQINPAEDGMADIVIGGQRGEDVEYRSERGSVRGNRNSMIAGSARRDAEEASVKSGRSSQGRREREVESRRDRDVDRRPLRRTTQTRYNY
ncbi:hypothetical protein BU23DRAFT_239666 [Bimuria novae-zelandiae CBS 107.79]|uniref:Uncharacterized protein n=1 Tax=Bimuria novae-zelandiae CBS 107.79 TaxID=1447943 RepID=A0A6A5UXT6_9PLEO|nr:hypothetical protein BU23DRAFT_239666 [Bimuria novae-zelandiae CBS 107.79]